MGPGGVFYALLLSLILTEQCACVVFVVNNGNHTLLRMSHLLVTLTVTDNYKVALLQFSAEWCHFSRQLAPIFEETSQKFLEETEKGEVAFGRIDCESNVDLCQKENIRKYPTVKVLVYGFMLKSEYRGARTVEALSTFVRDYLIENITEIDALQQNVMDVLDRISDSKETVVAIFPKVDPSNPHYQYYKRAAHLEKDNCNFYVIHNLTDEGDRLAHKESLTQKVKEITVLQNANFEAIRLWINQKCTPHLRELTFTNAEAITEEGLPLLLLFYDKKSEHLKQKLHHMVKTHLTEERAHVNFLVADGVQFSHPLSHLGKTVNDLPLICIDTLSHMYGLPKDAEEALSDPMHLKQFIADLKSGKLHREYHYGPDPVPSQPQLGQSVPHSPPSPPLPPDEKTTPPKSVFRKLGPSYLKYTLLHDEL
ncbi:Thiol-disulfide isomerase [Paragonimus heterotremus]|uniref:Thiol-disulfide isomerase n=1 Tax=Paragonimus heterotremus TaxID=100268 RepID=A0A8J4WSX8_9TREM|nr:Thiol-disulfide isomerase [Paragonimus heterotremus]